MRWPLLFTGRGIREQGNANDWTFHSRLSFTTPSSKEVKRHPTRTADPNLFYYCIVWILAQSRSFCSHPRNPIPSMRLVCTGAVSQCTGLDPAAKVGASLDGLHDVNVWPGGVTSSSRTRRYHAMGNGGQLCHDSLAAVGLGHVGGVEDGVKQAVI
jgi:hypothetical protein